MRLGQRRGALVLPVHGRQGLTVGVTGISHQCQGPDTSFRPAARDTAMCTCSPGRSWAPTSRGALNEGNRDKPETRSAPTPGPGTLQMGGASEDPPGFED